MTAWWLASRIGANVAELEQQIADVEAALHDVVNTVRCIDIDSHWRNNLSVRLGQLRFYVAELRKDAAGAKEKDRG